MRMLGTAFLGIAVLVFILTYILPVNIKTALIDRFDSSNNTCHEAWARHNPSEDPEPAFVHDIANPELREGLQRWVRENTSCDVELFVTATFVLDAIYANDRYVNHAEETVYYGLWASDVFPDQPELRSELRDWLSPHIALWRART